MGSSSTIQSSTHPAATGVGTSSSPPQPESGTCLEVHAKILSVLDAGSFYFAQREDCQFLAQRCWTDPGHGEMQTYAYHWENHPPVDPTQAETYDSTLRARPTVVSPRTLLAVNSSSFSTQRELP